MVLNLEEVVPSPEQLLIIPRALLGRLVVPGHDVLRDLARQAPREPDQPLRMLRQKLLRHARLAIEPMQRRLARQPHEILVPRLILREHQHVVVLRIRIRLPAMILFLAHIQLAPENRLQVALLHRIEEVHRAIDIAVVRDRRSLLPDLLQMLRQLVDIASPIQQRIIRMKMKVGKLSSHTLSLLPRYKHPCGGKAGTKLA